VDALVDAEGGFRGGAMLAIAEKLERKLRLGARGL